MSIHKERRRSLSRSVGEKEAGTEACSVHGSHELAKKIERKKMSARDENRHLDVKTRGQLSDVSADRSVLGAVRKQEEILGPREERSGRHPRRSLGTCLFARWTAPPFNAGTKDSRREGAVGGNRRAALQRHAPHDGEGCHDLVEGNRHRPESGGSGRGDAAG